MNLTGMSAPGCPIGNFLFLGPTGSGKTRIVEVTVPGVTAQCCFPPERGALPCLSVAALPKLRGLANFLRLLVDGGQARTPQV